MRPLMCSELTQPWHSVCEITTIDARKALSPDADNRCNWLDGTYEGLGPLP